LFGHESGAFTGAVRRKRGLLELAEGGTLLLNEIAELPLWVQAKLLTFLDSRSFTRVGGEKKISVSARLITATNKDLEKAVNEGRFREDLFYRLNVLHIKVPPLRERIEDIPILINSIMSELGTVMQLKVLPEVDPGTVESLCKYHWPGNVRELRNVLERSLIHSKEGKLDVRMPELHENFPREWSWTETFPPQKSFNGSVKDLKRSLIEEALRRSRGKRNDAANLLGITRAALKRQMKTLGFFGLE
jgi:DNA-binding NtrC family response regulator